MTDFIPFSIRNGYVSSNDCVIRESLPEYVQNAIQNAFSDLFSVYNIWPQEYPNMDADFGRYYLNLRTKDNQHKLFSPLRYADCDELEWYEKLDVFEWTFRYLFCHLKSEHIQSLKESIQCLNKELERHHYAYRIINGLFVEICSDIEIQCIDKALECEDDNIKTHLHRAISSISPSNNNPDYRNSIKESISAVGSYFRSNFGGTTLGEAIRELKKKHPNKIHRFILDSITNLYTYTNQPDTGIRHELLSQDYIPTHSDAIFMLVNSCNTINYLTSKLSTHD